MTMTGESGTALDVVAHATTFLFVPGDRPERFAKAARSGADVVIIDLEDAVAHDAKAEALTHAVAALTERGDGFRALVRINGETSSTELAALAGVAHHGGLLGVVIPKAESGEQIAAVRAAIPAHCAIIPLIETARGLVRVHEIAGAVGVTRIAFGSVDFAHDIDATEPALFDIARTQIVLASRTAELPAPIDSPCVTLTDAVVITAEAERAQRFGFGGKLCIHPAQVAPVDAAFEPSANEIDRARRIVAMEGGAVQLDGAMIDKPIVDRAKRLLARLEERS